MFRIDKLSFMKIVYFDFPLKPNKIGSYSLLTILKCKGFEYCKAKD